MRQSPISSSRPSLKGIIPRLPGPLQSTIRKRHYLRKLKAASLEDEPELASIALLTKPGDTVVDIGANFGLFTRFLSESVGERGRVYAFEPTPEMFAVLGFVRDRLNLTNTTLWSRALSDRAGSAEIRVPVRDDGTLNLYESTLDADGGAGPSLAHAIATTTLDAFCEEETISKVDFIKCDVEGHEIAVLNGARETLRRHRPTILLEVNEPLDRAGHGSEVRELVAELGYEIFTYRDGSIAPWSPGETFVNYVLKQAEA